MRNDDAIEIVRQMADGDSGQALNQFYAAYAGAVMGLVLRFLRSQAEAEELTQEIFCELWRRAPQYDRRRGSVKAWVARLARSRAIDWIRARDRRGAGRHVDAEDVVLPADPSGGPEAIATARRRSQLVHQALSELTNDQRQAVEMSYFGGMSHGEIARKLELPLGTVKSRILGAMRVLRDRLIPDGGAS